jgi:hypothetical protein
MGYKSFEVLEVYKAAREIRKKIYKLIKGLPPEEKNQFRRSNGYIAFLKKRKNQHTQST